MAEEPPSVPLPPDPFSPFVASDAEPWSPTRANHLYRRAGFGLNYDSLESVLKKSPQQAVDTLFDYDPEADPLNDLMDKVDGLVVFNRAESIQNWWFYRMVNTPRPFQEKLALYWHDHFATSLTKVDQAPRMHRQIELFRRKGLGSFRELLVGVATDPAMLVWLDGRDSRKGKPNENFAREVMELFTLGVGHYTEADIKELARCFTGWRIREGAGVLDPAGFDDGEKTVFGKTGKYDLPGAIDLILARDDARAYIASRLLKEFVHPHPTPELVAYYAGRLRNHDWQLKPVLREMLGSRLFFSRYAYRAKIKSPVELVVGACLALGGKANVNFLREQTARMGQNLLYPPNVKGWDGQEAWVNANTVLLRFNFGQQLATQRGEEFAKKSDLAGWLKKHNVKSADDVLKYYGTVLLDDNVPPADREALLDYLNRGADDQPKPFVLANDTINSKVRGLIHLLMSTPEYQLA